MGFVFDQRSRTWLHVETGFYFTDKQLQAIMDAGSHLRPKPVDSYEGYDEEARAYFEALDYALDSIAGDRLHVNDAITFVPAHPELEQLKQHVRSCITCQREFECCRALGGSIRIVELAWGEEHDGCPIALAWRPVGGFDVPKAIVRKIRIPWWRRAWIRVRGELRARTSSLTRDSEADRR